MKLYTLLGVVALLCLIPLSSCDDTSDSSSINSRSSFSETTADGKIRTTDTGPYSITHNTGLKIKSTFNGTDTIISANVFVPVATKENQVFPTIIFINSWAMDEYEYIVQAAKFAAKGYITLSYSCRGWGKSEGRIEMGGPEDWADFQAVVDWLEENTPIDIENLGVSGISLGGGGSLLAISHDPRVKTVTALSSYIDAGKSLFSDDTPRLVWGFMLVSTGTILGQMHKELYDMYLYTLTGQNIDLLNNWAKERSPITYIDNINNMNKPIYLSHNFGDHMFRSDVAIDYFNKLTVDHKHLDLNQGTHATGEIPGLISLPNHTYKNVHKWFDYWLKGIDTGIIPEGKNKSAIVTMEVKHTGERVEFDTDDLAKSDNSYSWPPQSTETKNYFLSPRTFFTHGKLKSSSVHSDKSNTIWSGLISGATSGIPIISQLLEQFKIPVITNINLLNRVHAIVFKTDKLNSTLKLRGTPEIEINLSVSKKKGQVFFYLYDVDAYGTAKYITMGHKTFWNAVPGQIQKIKIPFISAAYDIKAGHRFVLVMDTSNPEFGKPTITPFDIKIHFSNNNQSVLKVTQKK